MVSFIVDDIVAHLVIFAKNKEARHLGRPQGEMTTFGIIWMSSKPQGQAGSSMQCQGTEFSSLMLQT